MNSQKLSVDAIHLAKSFVVRREKMKQTIVSALVLTLLVALLGYPAVQVRAAGILYAAADGILEGPCTISAPCTIQTAISHAAIGDTIYLESGIYKAVNEADSRVVWITKSLTLTGSCDFSTGTAVCSLSNDPSIIQADLARRVIHIQISSQEDPGQVVLNYLHIYMGNAKYLTGCPSYGTYTTIGCGGGIFSRHDSKIVNLQVNSCKFWGNFAAFNSQTPGNEAGYGGAIFFLSPEGNLDVNTTFFQQNAGVTYGRGSGGAIFAISSNRVSINDSGFSENYCSSDNSEGSGCAIYAQDNADVVIDHNLFNLNNKTIYLVEGGAVHLYMNNHFVFHRNILSETTGASVVSGRSNVESTSGQLPDDFSQNWLWNNNATDAIFYQGKNAVNIFNNFIGHLSTAPAHILSGVKVNAPYSTNSMHVNILHNTIAYLDHGISLGNYLNVDLKNNIIAFNRVGAVDVYGTMVITINPDTNMIFGNPAGDLTGPNLIVANPTFVDGPNGNFHLRPNSPAIDAGLELGYISDIDNDHRPIGLPDIGADEYTAYIYLPIINR